MNAIDPTLHAQLAPLAAQVEQPMITIELRVPLRDVDFSRCECRRETDRYEVGGRILYLKSWDVDFTGAAFHGIPVEIPDSEFDTACDWIIEQRSGL